jgi:hypothetical protein
MNMSETTMTSENETKQKKEAKIRTSITINPELLESVRKLCAESDRSVSSFIEEALNEKLGGGVA